MMNYIRQLRLPFELEFNLHSQFSIYARLIHVKLKLKTFFFWLSYFLDKKSIMCTSSDSYSNLVPTIFWSNQKLSLA